MQRGEGERKEEEGKEGGGKLSQEPIGKEEAR